MRRIGLVSVVVALGAASVIATGATGASGSIDAGRVLRLNASNYSLDSIDPAIAYDYVTWRLEAMTCLRLLTTADRPGVAGAKLVPEASGPPRIANGGRTFTFTVKPGLRFADGSPLGAESFARAVERALAPKQASPAASFLHDLVGADAVLSGRRARPSGMTVKGRSITFRLEAPAADFLNRISMPFFCAVPPDTPIGSQAIRYVVGSGPYTITALEPGTVAVLEPNRYYRGPRPQRWDAVRIVSNVDANASYLQVRAGEVDLDLAGLPPTVHRQLGREYGVNRSRYFVTPTASIQYLALNTSRPFFADVATRRAAAYAIDRTALTATAGAYGGKVNDQVLAPGIPGYRDVRFYPNRPDPAKARALLAGKTGDVVLYTSNDAAGRTTAQIVRANLKAVGIDVTVKEFEFSVLYSKAGRKGEPFDMMVIGWFADYPDPFDFVNILLSGKSIGPANNVNFSYFDDPALNRRMEKAAVLFGDARAAAYARLDADLTRAAPLVVTGNGTSREFVSATLGCPMRSPTTNGLNLVMLCRKR